MLMFTMPKGLRREVHGGLAANDLQWVHRRGAGGRAGEQLVRPLFPQPEAEKAG